MPVGESGLLSVNVQLPAEKEPKVVLVTVKEETIAKEILWKRYLVIWLHALNGLCGGSGLNVK